MGRRLAAGWVVRGAWTKAKGGWTPSHTQSCARGGGLHTKGSKKGVARRCCSDGASRLPIRRGRRSLGSIDRGAIEKMGDSAHQSIDADRNKITIRPQQHERPAVVSSPPQQPQTRRRLRNEMSRCIGWVEARGPCFNEGVGARRTKDTMVLRSRCPDSGFGRCLNWGRRGVDRVEGGRYVLMVEWKALGRPPHEGRREEHTCKLDRLPSATLAYACAGSRPPGRQRSGQLAGREPKDRANADLWSFDRSSEALIWDELKASGQSFQCDGNSNAGEASEKLQSKSTATVREPACPSSSVGSSCSGGC